jgi:hypothetical protein
VCVCVCVCVCPCLCVYAWFVVIVFVSVSVSVLVPCLCLCEVVRGPGPLGLDGVKAAEHRLADSSSLPPHPSRPSLQLPLLTADIVLSRATAETTITVSAATEEPCHLAAASVSSTPAAALPFKSGHHVGRAWVFGERKRAWC